MGVLSRFKDIMASNINSILDKAEDPAKMIDQALRDLNESLAEVKKETASVIADETRVKRELDECTAEVSKLTECAKKALLAGNEADAKTLLEKKASLVKKQESLQTTFEVSHANAEKMRAMHDKLSKDIAELDDRKDVIKSKVATAKAQSRVNQVTGSTNSSASFSAFERMEAKADKMLDSANAEAELNEGSGDDIKDITDKYTSGSVAVDDELDKMKAELGI